MLIISHLKKGLDLEVKETLLNEREHNLNIYHDHLTKASNLLERNLNGASDLIDRLGELENNMCRTIDNVDNIINQQIDGLHDN